MTNRTHSALLLFVVVAGVAACDRPGSPTGPTPTAPPPVGSVAPTVNGGESIKGTVSDSALRRLAGARVELLDGTQAGLSAMTDASGEFSLVANSDDATRFRASKEGHVTADAAILPNCDRCNPKRWVHFLLSVVEPAVALAGNYTLTFIADSACAKLPEEVRTRSYDATISPGDLSWPGFPAQTGTSFKVTPVGSAFPAGLNYFWLNVAGNFVAVVLGDHTDPGVTRTRRRGSQRPIFAIPRMRSCNSAPRANSSFPPRIRGSLGSARGPEQGIEGNICRPDCVFVVRFGTKDGERRAYLTVDYGHDNPGTLVDVEVASGALVVTQTDLYPPGSPTLSGVVTEVTAEGPMPVEGVSVYRGVITGWRLGTTDKNGFYEIRGLFDGVEQVEAIKEGFGSAKNSISIKGDTRFDIQIVRP